MPKIPFAFVFECEQLNDLSMAELLFNFSEKLTHFLLKMAIWLDISK